MSPYFPRRVSTWFVVSKLIAYLDDPSITGYTRRVVKAAIDIEWEKQIKEIWGGEIQA